MEVYTGMNKTIVFSILTLLVLSVTLVSAETIVQEFTESSNVGNLVGPLLNSEDISVQGAKVTSEQSSFGTNTRVDITKEEGSLKIKDSEFKNIQPAKEGQEAYFQLGEDGKVKECNFKTNKNGGNYSLGNYNITAPPNSTVKFKDGIIEIIPSENIELTEENMPKLKEQSDLQKGVQTVNFKALNGKTITLPNGNVLQEGDLIFENGQAYLTDNSKINDLSVKLSEKSRTQIFLDGEAHNDLSDNYISLNANERKIYVSSKDINLNINFEENNPFVEIKDNARFSLSNTNNDIFELAITNPPGKIPHINVQSLKGGTITDGRYVFSTTGPFKKEIYVNTPEIIRNYETETTQYLQDYKTTSVSMQFQDKGNLASNKAILVTDDSYGVLKIDGGKFQKNVLLNNGVDLTETSRLELIESIKTTNPEIQFENIEKVPLIRLQEMQEQLGELTPELKDSTKKIIFAPMLDSPGGQADLNGNVFIAYEDLAGLPAIPLIPHEFAHNLDTIQGKNELDIEILNKESDKLIKDINEFMKKTQLPDLQFTKEDFTGFNGPPGSTQLKSGKIVEALSDESSEKVLEISREVNRGVSSRIDVFNEFKRSSATELNREWWEAQLGEGYSINNRADRAYQDMMKIDIDSRTNNPKDGFLNDYGKNNIQEDKATFVEQVYRDPSYFAELVNPTSPQYDARYVKKLELLKKYGFISEEKFNEIFKAAGLMN